MEPNEETTPIEQSVTEPSTKTTTETVKHCVGCIHHAYDTFCGYNALCCNIHGVLEGRYQASELDEKAKNCPDFEATELGEVHAAESPSPATVSHSVTYDTLDLPSYDEALKQTLPDFDDFSTLRGKLGISKEFSEFTTAIRYKVKVDPLINGRDYRVDEMPKYPKFLALFSGKTRVGEITLFEVNELFSKEKFTAALDEDRKNNALAEASAKIMKHMQEEERFSFAAPLTESDLAILKEYFPDTSPYTNFTDLLSKAFIDMLPPGALNPDADSSEFVYSQDGFGTEESAEEPFDPNEEVISLDDLPTLPPGMFSAPPAAPYGTLDPSHLTVNVGTMTKGEAENFVKEQAKFFSRKLNYNPNGSVTTQAPNDLNDA